MSILHVDDVLRCGCAHYAAFVADVPQMRIVSVNLDTGDAERHVIDRHNRFVLTVDANGDRCVKRETIRGVTVKCRHGIVRSSDVVPRK